MKKIKSGLLIIPFLALAGFLIASNGAYAQENNGNPVPVGEIPQPDFSKIENTAIQVSNVSIAEPKVESQEENKFNIIFSVKNPGTSQGNLRYGVRMVQDVNDKRSVVDEKFFDDMFGLASNESVGKKIEYVAPAFLKGKFESWLFLVDGNGGVLSLMKVSDIELNGSGEYLLVSDCNLQVATELGKKYQLQEGVVIRSSESLIGQCQVKNLFSQKKDFGYSFDVYLRSSSGKLISNGKASAFDLSVEKDAVKVFNFAIPKVSKSQAYDAVLALKDPKGADISNKIAFHFVLQGEGATIQNLRFDKSYYSAGDKAQVELSWSSAADNYPGSRIQETTLMEGIGYEGIIKDKDGRECAKKFQGKLSGKVGGLEKISVEITKKCADPGIEISILNKNGEKMDSGSWGVKSEASQLDTKKKSLLDYILIPFLILLLIILVLILIKLRFKKSSISILLFLISSLGIFTSFSFSAQAASTAFDVWTPYVGARYTFSLGDTQCAGRPMTLSSWIQELNCGNGYTLGERVYQNYWSYDYANWNIIGSTREGGAWTSYPTAPSSPGGYYLYFGGYDWNCINGTGECFTGWGTSWVYYNVITAPASPGWFTATCNSSYQATLSWGGVSGASNYLFRFDDPTTGGAACPASGNDICDSWGSTSRTIGVVPGRTYSWWVHANNACGNSGGVGGSFTCTCTAGCGAWSACSSCGQSRTCTRADCSTYTETISCGAVNCGWDNWYNVGGIGTYLACYQLQYRGYNPSPACGGSACSGASAQYIGPYGVTNGACASTHYNCSAGTLGSTAEYPDAANPSLYAYQWWCNGICGGSNTLCTEMKPSGVCGSSNGQTFCTAPTTNLCSVGTASAVSGTGPWSWSCLGGTNANCNANKDSVINGACGSAKDTPRCDAPATNLCASGTASAVSGTGPWTWSCSGLCGGALANCSVSKDSAYNGACGTATSNPSCQPPSSNLCNVGSASNVTVNGTKWNWTCSGYCGGTSTPCFSDKNCQTNWKEVIP